MREDKRRKKENKREDHSYGTMNNCTELLNLSMEFEYECKELGIFI